MNLSDLVVDEAVNTINHYWLGLDPDTEVVEYRTGILDFGLLGNI